MGVVGLASWQFSVVPERRRGEVWRQNGAGGWGGWSSSGFLRQAQDRLFDCVTHFPVSHFARDHKQRLDAPWGG